MTVGGVLQAPEASDVGSTSAAGAPSQIVLVDARERATALATWRELEERLTDVPLMGSYDWSAAWLRHYGDIVPHRFALLRSGHHYVGAGLITRGLDDRDGLFHERAWHFGTAGEHDADSAVVEYNAVACEPGFVGDYFQQLMAQLNTERDWDALKWDGFALSDLPLPLEANDQFLITRKEARWTDLRRARESGAELLRLMGDSTRKNIRQCMRKTTDLRFEWAESTDHAADIFEDLIRLHQTRWQAEGHPGCYASARFTNFHRDLLTQLVPQGKMILGRLSSGAEVLACSQLLIDRKRALVYQGGRVPESPVSPGLLIDFLCMEECLHRGLDAYDFMAGDSMHKRRLTTETTPLYWATLRRPRWKYRCMESLRQWRRQSEALLQRFRQPKTTEASASQGDT